MTSSDASTRSFHVTHATRYAYAERVSLSYHQAMLKPRSTTHQEVHTPYLHVKPEARTIYDRDDYFGNRVSTFELDAPHAALEVIGESIITLEQIATPILAASQSLEDVRAAMSRPPDAAGLTASEFVAESRFIPKSPELAAFARPHFPPGRPYLEGVRDLMRHIFEHFRYDPKVTSISTPVSEVLHHKHGVCQDFAHLMIAALRSLGGPARYISGYLVPLPGVVGAQASHAWVSAYCPTLGWVDFDPTNDVIPSNGHITLAWGRDFADVSPLRGVIFGGGDHTVDVEVKIT
ncbi:MAG: transglutaminase family protein [Bryobacterales bacterium]